MKQDMQWLPSISDCHCSGLSSVLLQMATPPMMCIYDWEKHILSEDTVASNAFKISAAAAAGTAAEILVNGNPNPASFDPQNPDNVQILTLAQKLGAPEGTNIETFIPCAKETVEFHREVFDKMSGFFLQR